MNVEDISILPPTDPCWQFPAGLHGTRSDAKKFSARLAKSLLLGESMSDLLSACPRVSVLDDSDFVFVRAKLRAESAGDIMWRVRAFSHELQEAVFSRIHKGEKVPAPAESLRLRSFYERVMFEVANELWHALSFLDVGLFGVCFVSDRISWSRSALAVLVRWLPEMWLLSKRIYCMLPPHWAHESIYNPRAQEIAILAKICGYEVNLDDYLQMRVMPVDGLVRDGVIRLSSSRRFELVSIAS
ncbi:hypothetical protein [Planctomicrobium piriforme]|uniref:Uncharacterized protein n=1 Tax=Planctomicrobium piriforme TaxID=1576369 RepID=A0A1I3F056_9PLAN|nr:hypothetical protein [Planctomicrobium piriforme]SFI04587.1 hypothetical protein SAMN05421753_10518 [Planctomicrobium piriforme]